MYQNAVLTASHIHVCVPGLKTFVSRETVFLSENNSWQVLQYTALGMCESTVHVYTSKGNLL